MPGIIVARGNKCVDNLAGIAAVVTGRAMDWADIMNAIRETRPEKNVSNNYHRSVGLNRLQECQVQKKGGGGEQTKALWRQPKETGKPIQSRCCQSVHAEIYCKEEI